MTSITIAQLQAAGACYSTERLEEIFAGRESLTAQEVIDYPGIPNWDKLWVFVQCFMQTDKQRRLFACDCAERAMRLVSYVDQRSSAAIAVARRFANGEATAEELAAAREAARVAAQEAAWEARDAAWNTARDAARDAAWDTAARAAASEAACCAAEDAARVAASEAACCAAEDAARVAAWDAAWAAEQQWQLQHAIELVNNTTTQEA